MPTITVDTTATDDDGNIHAVLFQALDLPARDPDVWVGVDVGTTVTLVDQTTGVESTGTIASYETSVDPPTNPLTGGSITGKRAIRIELVITPT